MLGIQQNQRERFWLIATISLWQVRIM